MYSTYDYDQYIAQYKMVAETLEEAIEKNPNNEKLKKLYSNVQNMFLYAVDLENDLVTQRMENKLLRDKVHKYSLNFLK